MGIIHYLRALIGWALARPAGRCLAFVTCTFVLSLGRVGPWISVTGFLLAVLACIGLARHKVPIFKITGRRRAGFLLTGALLVWVLGITITQRTPGMNHRPDALHNDSPLASEQQSPRMPVIDASAHLAAAKEALADGYRPTGADPCWGRVADAREHLLQIGPSDSGYLEARTLLQEVGRREVQIEKWATETASKLLTDQRVTYAQTLEKEYLKQGMDIYITVSGADNTTIRLKYVLMSRPIVYQLTSDEDAMNALRQQGFKKLILTDGYDSTWTYDL